MSPRHVFAFAVLIGWLLPAVAVAAGVPLADAAERGDLAAVRSLIGQGSDVNAARVDGTDRAARRRACRSSGHRGRCCCGPARTPARRDRYGVTPLYLACVNGNAEMIRRLLDAGVDPEYRRSRRRDGADDGRAHRRAWPRCALLLERGAARGRTRAGVPADRADDRGPREPRGGRANCCSRPAPRSNAQTRKGPTPAFVPPCKGTGCGSEGVGINRGGLPDRGRRAEVKGGMTPLLYAARDGRLDAARLLVAAGADLELADGNGIRPLLMAAAQQPARRRAAPRRAGRERERRRLLGPLAALGGGRIPQPGHEQQRPGQPDRQRRRSRADSRLDPAC